jgi:hypothetical protein
VTPQAEILRTILKVMDAERTLDSIEAVACQFLDMYTDDLDDQGQYIPYAIEDAKWFLVMGYELCKYQSPIDHMELTEKEKAVFKETFRNRSPKLASKFVSDCFCVVFQCKGSLGYVRVYCLATDPDCAVAIAANELYVQEIFTEKLLSAVPLKWPPKQGVKHNHEMMVDTLVHGTVGIEFLAKV